MIRFPETLQAEWKALADAANASTELRKKIERGTAVEKELEKLRVRHEAATKFQQELDSDQTPTLEMTTLAEYKNSPSAAPKDMIEGVLKEDGMCIVIGAAESGKSTLALQMIHSLSTGAEFLHQPVQAITGGVGIASYDMDSSMMMDWMDGFPGVDASSISVINAYKRGHPIGVPALRTQIATAWRALGVEIVVIDSFSASFFGHSQNDAAEVMQHYRDLKLFALTEVGAKALIVIAHSTSDSPHKVRGSTVHHDVADSIVSVEVTKTGLRKVDIVKYRAARGQARMLPVILTKPDDVTHLSEVHAGAMSMASMTLPAGLQATAFPPLPTPNEEPEDSDSEQEDIV